MKMATYRRIDIGLFDQKWVDELAGKGEAHYVLLYIFLIVNCKNPAGIFEVNPRFWNFKLNPSTPFTGEDVFVKFGKRIRRIEGHPDKGLLVGFCDHQCTYGRNSSQWEWVEKSLKAVGLTFEDIQKMDEQTQPEFDFGLPPPVRKQPKAATEPKQRNVIPPKVEWVAAYCEQRKNGINAQHFCDWYQQRGWKVGRVRMIDWEAAVRTWEQRNKENAATVRPNAPVKNVVGKARRKF